VEVVRLRERGPAHERDSILKAVGGDDTLVVLDERGTIWSTVELASRLSQWQQRGLARLTFVLGGADGLHPDVRARAQAVWSLSRLTLPHRLALVIVTEQLYRAHTVLAHEPYHRAGVGSQA
jgi:23S rRNA (pseudouridine1915-N3)-methyltransferase